jgi:hypothetical protein
VQLWFVQMDPSAGIVLQNSVHFLIGNWGFWDNLCCLKSYILQLPNEEREYNKIGS